MKRLGQSRKSGSSLTGIRSNNLEIMDLETHLKEKADQVFIHCPRITQSPFTTICQIWSRWFTQSPFTLKGWDLKVVLCSVTMEICCYHHLSIMKVEYQMKMRNKYGRNTLKLLDKCKRQNRKRIEASTQELREIQMEQTYEPLTITSCWNYVMQVLQIDCCNWVHTGATVRFWIVNS